MVLPMVTHAVEDKPDPKEWRPILNIKYSGEIIVTRETYYNPEIEEGHDD